ncbi:hypothetical protein EJ110_NYTH08464 [Nymphaea thermarum]|nr:hypothetical protein EJ110_NYTH08464 [Nymphaea thermarum]
MGCSIIYCRLSAAFALEEAAPLGDCILHCCCAPCALCQEQRELKSRGYDPTVVVVVAVFPYQTPTPSPKAITK